MRIKRFNTLFESSYDKSGVMFVGSDSHVTKFMRATNEDTAPHAERRGDERVYVKYEGITPATRAELDDQLIEFAGLKPEDEEDRRIEDVKDYCKELCSHFTGTNTGRKALRDLKSTHSGYRSDDGKADELAADLTANMLTYYGLTTKPAGKDPLPGHIASRLRLVTKSDTLKEVSSEAKALFKSKYE